MATATGASTVQDHAGIPITLVNDPLTRANPYTNHLRWCIDSEVVCPGQSVVARYKLPGLLYAPEESSEML